MTIAVAADNRLHAHKLVARTARDMAHAIWNTMAKDNSWFQEWKSHFPKGTKVKALELAFVQHTAPGLVPDARRALAMLLNTNMAEHLKDEIAEALISDNGLRHGSFREHLL